MKKKPLSERVREYPETRNPMGYWDDARVINESLDNLQKTEGKITKALIITHYGSGLWHSIERNYGTLNKLKEERGDEANSFGGCNKSSKVPVKRGFGKKPGTVLRDRIRYTFQDSCDGYEILRGDSREPIPKKRYSDHFGIEAIVAILRGGHSYESFVKMMEEKIKGMNGEGSK